MKLISKVLFATTLTSAALAVGVCRAAMPSGAELQVNDALNRVWNFGAIAPLQSPSFSITDPDGDDTDISFDASFTQTPSGKLVGSGPTHIYVSGPFDVDFDGNYMVKGTITSSRGVTRLTYQATAGGSVVVQGRSSTLKASFSIKGVLDSVNQTFTGTQAAAGSASGVGGAKSQEPLDVTWSELMALLGEGSWHLQISLQNDGVKKLMGTAVVHLSDSSELNFAVKGVYKGATDTSVLVLSGTQDSLGSTLKVTMLGNSITSIKGKLAGQMVSVTNP